MSLSHPTFLLVLLTLQQMHLTQQGGERGGGAAAGRAVNDGLRVCELWRGTHFCHHIAVAQEVLCLDYRDNL